MWLGAGGRLAFDAVPATDSHLNELPTTCVVGAGPNGLALARALTTLGLPVEVYERHTSIGGLWAADNPKSPIYESAHFISSKTQSAFPGFPFPESVPDYPGGAEIRAYLDDFVDTFGLRDVITTGCGVAHADWDGARWAVELDDGTTRTFDHFVCANGSQWHPTMPDIAGTFAGRLIHSVEYSSIDELRHQRVLVIGAGNSGTDIACDAAASASRAALSMRRGYHFLPKHIFGIPSDVFATSGPELPMAISQRIFPAMLRMLVGRPERFGLPKPDHKLFETHPIVNSEIFHFLSHGDLVVRPDVDHFDGQDVHFVDGTSEPFDVVICATGYTVEVPYLDDSHFEWKHGKPQLLMELFSRTNPYLHATGFAEGDSGGFPLFDVMADAIANVIQSVGRAVDGPPPKPWLDHLAQARPETRGKAKLKDLPRNVNYIHRSAYEKVVASMREDFGWREYSPPTVEDAKAIATA